MANSVDLDQTAPIGAVCSGSTLFASILSAIIFILSSLFSSRAVLFASLFGLMLYVSVNSYGHVRDSERSVHLTTLFFLGKLDLAVNTYIHMLPAHS